VGYSLRDVEEQTGIDHSAVSKFESGAGMSIANVVKLAEVYGERLGRHVTVDELIADAPQETPVG
jgi:transcriptional regulator with XRE-family HTH domain